MASNPQAAKPCPLDVADHQGRIERSGGCIAVSGQIDILSREAAAAKHQYRV